MIQETTRQQIISIWDNYIANNKKVIDTKGNFIENIDEKRIASFEPLKKFLNDFLSGKSDLNAFKTEIDSFNKQNNYWGFTSIKGQMFFNLLLKTSETEEQQNKLTKLLIECISEPKNLNDALTKIEHLEKYASSLFNSASDKRKAPNPGSVCYFLSYFWQIQNHNNWPIMYSSIINVLIALGLWSDTSDPKGAYEQFFNINEDIKKILSSRTNKPISNWDAEHSFWNFRTVNIPAKSAVPKESTNNEIEVDIEQTIYNSSFNIYDYIIPAVAKLTDYGNEKEKSASAKGSQFEKIVCEIFKQLDFEVLQLGQGTGREPDLIIKHREENTAFIVDAKAYSNGYSLSTADERAIKEYILHHCPKLQKEGYKKIGFIIVSNSFRTSFETFINDITWNTDIKRFILLESKALLHLLAYKNRNKTALSYLIESLISFGDLVTTQNVIQKFDDV